MCSCLQLRHSPGDLARNCRVGTRCFALPTECVCLFFFSDALLFGCDIGALSLFTTFFFLSYSNKQRTGARARRGQKGLVCQLPNNGFALLFLFFFTFNIRRQHTLLPLCQCALFCCLCGVEPFFLLADLALVCYFRALPYFLLFFMAFSLSLQGHMLKQQKDKQGQKESSISS